MNRILLLPNRRYLTAPEVHAASDAPLLVACDFYVDGIERTGEALPWGFRAGRVVNVDHHAPVRRNERIVSSTNLVLAMAEAGELPLPAEADVVITHLDCDSVLSAGIASGRLPPDPAFGVAAIAADHTGEPNPIADLLQGLDAEQARRGMRDIELCFASLEALLAGRPLPGIAAAGLAKRLALREAAHREVERGAFARIGDVFHAAFDEPIDGEFFPALLPEAAVIVLGNPLPVDRSRWQLKFRLGARAPEGVTLDSLGIRDVDPAYGGRWNAGSNRNGGGSKAPPAVIAAYLAGSLARGRSPGAPGSLERAIAIAMDAHASQVDKAGASYILHPLRVMTAMPDDDVARIAAVLHDVVEDSHWTLDDLAREGFSADALGAVEAVTKREGEDYFAFCARAGEHPVGRLVKLADLRDNMDLSRLPEVTDKDRERLDRYSRVLDMLAPR